jgi:hypothetical protein
MQKEPATKEQYQEAFDGMKARGFTDMMFHSPNGRADLKADPVYVKRDGEYVAVENLYLKQL